MKNEKGISLVELLASIVLISILCIATFSIIVSSQTQNKEQSKETKQINDAAYVLKVVTKDIRNTNKITKTANDYEFLLHDNSAIVYKFTSKEISRNGAVIANNISDFKIVENVTNETVHLSFTLNGKFYETILSFRKGSI